MHANDRRFLFIFPADEYYGHMGRALAAAFREAGLEALCTPISSLAPRNVTAADVDAVHAAVRSFAPTDTFTVNVPKTTLRLPAGVRHHCWIQDLYEWKATAPNTSDVTYVMTATHAVHLGFPHLPPATDYHCFRASADRYDADVAFAGFLPPATCFFSTDPEFNQVCTVLYRAIHEKMLAVGDFFSDPEYASYLLRAGEIDTGLHIPSQYRPVTIYHIASRLVRHAQRKRLMDALVPMCERRRWRLAIAGDNWKLGPLYEPYCRPRLPAGAPLAEFFRRTRVNLQINGDTNLHPRVLECLGAGSFVLSGKHVSDAHPGGLHEALPPAVAPTFASMEDLELKLAFYVANDEVRNAAAAEGSRIVEERHSFRARVETILATGVPAVAAR
jgi:hypothetical protein